MRHAMPVLAATALALVACDAPTGLRHPADGTPRPAVIVNDRTENTVFLSGLNGCGGDVLQGTGTLHTVIGATEDAAGGFHLTIKEQFSNVRLTGSPSGATYVANQQYGVNVTLHAGYEETVHQTLTLVGQGQAPNALVRFRFRIAINANGELTHSVSDFTVDCH